MECVSLTRLPRADVHRAILWKGAERETERPKEVEHLAKALVKLALELEGTCAGEHGIGCVLSLSRQDLVAGSSART